MKKNISTYIMKTERESETAEFLYLLITKVTLISVFFQKYETFNQSAVLGPITLIEWPKLSRPTFTDKWVSHRWVLSTNKIWISHKEEEVRSPCLGGRLSWSYGSWAETALEWAEMSSEGSSDMPPPPLSPLKSASHASPWIQATTKCYHFFYHHQIALNPL